MSVSRSVRFPAPFDAEQRFRFQSLHANAMIRVIARHLASGYRLKGVETGGRGYRVDLLFESPSGRTRLSEVKSSKRIRAVHRIQAALYPHPGVDEVAVSNSQDDEIIGQGFIEEMRNRAEQTSTLLNSDPIRAATTYKPNEDCCYICANETCPFLFLAKTINRKASAS